MCIYVSRFSCVVFDFAHSLSIIDGHICIYINIYMVKVNSSIVLNNIERILIYIIVLSQLGNLHRGTEKC